MLGSECKDARMSKIANGDLNWSDTGLPTWQQWASKG